MSQPGYAEKFGKSESWQEYSIEDENSIVGYLKAEKYIDYCAGDFIDTAVNSYDSNQETIRELTEALHTLADELTCGAPKGRFSKERVKTWTGTLAQMARHAALDRAKKGT